MNLVSLLLWSAVIAYGSSENFLKNDPTSSGFNVTECGPLDIGLIIDASGSIGPRRFTTMLTFLSDALRGGDYENTLRVSAVTFSKRSVVEFLFNTHIHKPDPEQEILNNIAEMVYTKGVTNTSGALRMAREELFQQQNGDREEVQNLAVIITDGNSNVDRDPVQDADKLKEDGVYIFGIAVGTDKSINIAEIEAIVSYPDELVRLKTYNDLIPFRETIIKRMCKPFQPPKNCNEGEVKRKKCRKMQCVDGNWKYVGFYGCCYKGRFLNWGEDLVFECDKFRCYKDGDCDDNVCEHFSVTKVSDGCLVGDRCVAEGVSVVEENACETYRCVDGVYTMIQKDCLDSHGKCVKVGGTYTEHCVTYQCQAVDGMVEFRPIRTGCSYNGNCYNLGATVVEDCNTLVCCFDDFSQRYDFVLQKQGCNDNGYCRSVGDTWVNLQLCIRYRCVYSKKLQRVIIRERSMGCQGDNGCVKKGTEVSSQGCIKYVCTKKGDLQVISVGCEFNGYCKAVNETWPSTAEKCTTYICRADVADDGTPTSYIERTQDCHDFNGNCVKVGGLVQDNCNTYKCDPNGHMVPTSFKCSYKGRCYDIGAVWVDSTSCHRLKCRKKRNSPIPRIIKKRIGCVDENGKCYLVNGTKELENSCLKYKCYEDRVLRQEVCEYKHKCYAIGDTWVDKDDCVTVKCIRDPCGCAQVETEPYGCFVDHVCHDPGYTYTKDCQQYECIGGGAGFHVIQAACVWKGKCKAKGETWFDIQTCTKYGCIEDEDGLDVTEITYGCTSESNQCIRGGAQHGDGCNKYECVDGKLHVLAEGCDFNGGCLEAGKKYFDKVNCVLYKCVLKNTTEGSIYTQLKERWGCLDYDKCYLPTWKKTEDCTTYRCRGKTRSFSVFRTDCEWMGKCMTLNSTWEHPTQCVKYTCSISQSTGVAHVSSNLYGCKDESGKCHAFGTQLQSKKCVTMECQMRPEGPAFIPTEVGCRFRRRCKKLDSTWINRRACVQQTCQQLDEASPPTIINVPYGCRDMKKRCRPFGYVAMDPNNGCTHYTCTPYEIFSPTVTGCSWEGQCKRENEVWYDEKTCTTHRCVRENLGPGNVEMHVESDKGCELNGRCLKPNEQVQNGCAAYKCDPSGYLMVIDMLGCVYEGECKAINSTWFDPKTCTTYTCVYDSDVHDISIVEKTGCKDDNGRCFTTGEGTVEGCNKYLCSETSNFKPTQIRCEFQGECKEIDSTWTEGCVTYTCKLIARGPDYVQTKVIESHGCVGENGHCYKVGDDIIQRGCSKSTCKPGGIMQETQFGCIGPNDQCLEPGSKIVLECVTYVCDGEAKSLVPVGKGCVWKGECKPVDTKWFDKETCRGYTCAMDIADNDVKIIERTIGCTVDGKCKRSRTTHMKDCVQYRCTTRGELVPKKISCEWDGECKDVGSTWTKNCIHYKCVITQEGPDYVQTEVIQRRGCIDSYGRCHSVMDEVSFGCNKYRCEMGGSMVLIGSGCMDRYGRCMKPGELVEEPDGSTHKCVCDGSSCVVVTEVKGCKLNGTLYPFGHTIKEGCTVYECQKYDRCGMYVPIQWGCYWVDRCYGPGDMWKSETGCSIYTCTMNQKPNRDVDMVVSRDIGCPHDDECKLNGEVWRDGCFEKKCKVRNTKDGSRESSIKIISGACQEGLGDGMICHDVGSIWEEQHYDGCFKKQCSKDQVQENKYITTIIGSACRDAYGACRPVGSTGFSAYVNGQLSDDCKCSAMDGDVEKVKYECGAPDPIMCQQDC